MRKEEDDVHALVDKVRYGKEKEQSMQGVLKEYANPILRPQEEGS